MNTYNLTAHALLRLATLAAADEAGDPAEILDLISGAEVVPVFEAQTAADEAGGEGPTEKPAKPE